MYSDLFRISQERKQRYICKLYIYFDRDGDINLYVPFDESFGMEIIWKK